MGHFPGPRHSTLENTWTSSQGLIPSPSTAWRGRDRIRAELAGTGTDPSISSGDNPHTRISSLYVLGEGMACTAPNEQPRGCRPAPAELGSQMLLSHHTPSLLLLINEAEKEGPGGSSQPCPSCTPPQAPILSVSSTFLCKCPNHPFQRYNASQTKPLNGIGTFLVPQLLTQTNRSVALHKESGNAELEEGRGEGASRGQSYFNDRRKAGLLVSG